MTNPDNSISAIESLLQERQRYEGWLATLETRRESTPGHVYERVREDYEARLREVLDRLGGRSGELKMLVETLAGRVATLEGDEATRRDAMAEAELRALVGEYAPDEWEKLRAERDAEIERLRQERTGLTGELARVQELLTKANAEPRFATPAPGVGVPPAPAARPAPAAPVAPEAEPEFGYADRAAARRAPDGPSGVPAPTTAAPARQSGFDELAFLQSLSDGSGAARQAPPSAPAAPPPAPAAAPAPPPVAPRPAPVNEQARALTEDFTGRPAEPQPRATSPVMRPLGHSESRPSSSQDQRRSSDVPAFLRDVPSEQVKTLKCQECGTMNYPTEWYCERCGGELAAM